MWAHLSIAEAQAFAGDKAGARETIARVEPLIPKKPDLTDYYILRAMAAADDNDDLRNVIARNVN